MYLSKLELFGFKSFPSKTKIFFDQGMTAIVGPNGCGKTNIVDAIRWVLGEQKTSVLRGDKMEEVIFHGTTELKPLGMAEVSLILDNKEGILPIEYTEVSITRRLFRSGESEYYINKNLCRLKDIIDLFLDTGMGAHTYSVLQREMIDVILSDQAEERRFLFEEASGISKYKKRKKAAQRKLEATKNDLLRIADITKEVERQVNSLKRQAQKGERFKKYKDELKDLEIKLAGFDIKKFLHSDQNIKKSLEDLEKARMQLSEKTKEKEVHLQRLKAQLLEIEKEHYGLQKEKEGLSQRTYEIEREKSIGSERETNLKELVTKTKEQKENLETRLVKINEEKKAKEEALQDSSERFRLKERDDVDLESKLKGKQEEYQKAQESHETICKSLEEIELKENQIKMNMQNLQIQLTEAEKDESRCRQETESISDKLSSTSREIDELTISLEKDKEQIDLQGKEKTRLEEELRASELTLEKSSLEKVRVESSLDSQREHLRLLEEIIVSYQGYQSGIRSLLEQKENLPGIVDRIANLFTPEDRYSKAIQTLLGESLNFVACKDTESAKKGIDYLRENKKGNVTFLILDKFKNLDLTKPELNKPDSDSKWATDVIKCQEEFRPLMNFLLGKVLIVPSFEDAFNFTSEENADLTLVSVNGEVVEEGRIIRFGQKEGLFFKAKEKESDDTNKRIIDLQNRLKQIKEEKTRIEAEKNSDCEALSDREEKLKAHLRNLQEKEFRSKQSKIEKSQMEKRLKEVKAQMQDIGSTIHQLRENLKEKNEECSILEKEKEKIAQNKRDSEEGSKELEESKDRIHQELNEFRIKIVTLQGRTEQLKNDKKRLGELILEIENNIKSKEEDIKDWGKRIEEISREKEGVEQELKKVLELKESKSGIFDSKTYIKNDCTQKVNEIEEGLKEIRDQKEKFQEETHSLEMEKLKISNEIQKLKENIWEEYRMDITKLAPPEKDEEAQIDDSMKRRDFLKERLEGIGPVNLLALDEYRSQKQRLDFLNKQFHDLVNAKESLNSAILTINKTARRLFLETFDKIRINFQKIFSELFQGGVADLWLEDDKDPLESNIGISASPRGKRLLKLDQLSGGEKAMVAISLLFGIYLVKPSPLCILDEVDAPLDDANLARFLKLIRSFSKQTQFMIITHNKLSMEASDVLYGVTMEKPGVSKTVSVRLEKEEVKSRDLRVKSVE